MQGPNKARWVIALRSDAGRGSSGTATTMLVRQFTNDNHGQATALVREIAGKRMEAACSARCRSRLHCGRAAHRAAWWSRPSRPEHGRQLPAFACVKETYDGNLSRWPWRRSRPPAARVVRRPPSASATGTWTAAATWWPPQVRHVVARPGRRRSAPTCSEAPRSARSTPGATPTLRRDWGPATRFATGPFTTTSGYGVVIAVDPARGGPTPTR